MAAVGDSGPDQNAEDPYARLGLSQGASFEQVQQARQACLDQVGDDQQARARVESAYDAVLMSRLRERQQGQLSEAAADASVREESGNKSTAFQATGVLQKLQPKLMDAGQAISDMRPQVALVQGPGLWIRLGIGSLAMVALLLSSDSVQLVLALGLIGGYVSAVRRGRRPLSSLGWTLASVVVGLVAGGVLAAALSPSAVDQLNLNSDQIQAIPAAVLLWLTALLLA
ncbi:CPP1-like family protein [Parasynechococcus sp.]|jgi:hypothetical protein|uniref:CPP1-like family protein n=1 Tax=Parasynechococcus sp. TaxID=3101203 RepID=UPI0037045C33